MAAAASAIPTTTATTNELATVHPAQWGHLPHISLVCWRNAYQQNIDPLITGCAKSASGVESLLVRDKELAVCKMLPGTGNDGGVDGPSDSNKAVAVKASAAWREAFPNTVAQQYASEATASDRNRSPLSCVVWPLFGGSEAKSHQMFMLSDIVVVFINSYDPLNANLLDSYIKAKIGPLLVVATSRAGVEAHIAPLHCVLLDEATRDANDFDSVVTFCRKANESQKRLNIAFTAMQYDSTIQPALINNGGNQCASRVPLGCPVFAEDSVHKFTTWEVVMNAVATTHAKLLKASASASGAHVDPNKAAAAAAAAVRQDTALKRDLRTFSVVGVSRLPQRHGFATINLVVACHEFDTARLLLSVNKTDKNYKEENGSLVVTAAKSPGFSSCEVVETSSIFLNRRCKLLSVCLRSRSAAGTGSLTSLFFEFLKQFNGPQPLTGAGAKFLGLFSVGSVWGICRVQKPKPLPAPEERQQMQRFVSTNVGGGGEAEDENNSNSNNNNAAISKEGFETKKHLYVDDEDAVADGTMEQPAGSSSFSRSASYADEPPAENDGHESEQKQQQQSLADAVGFHYFNDFPACPHIVIVRVPKLHARFCRGIGGTLTLSGFGGDANVDVVAIASVAEKRLMEVALPAVGGDVYYAFHLPAGAPLFVFDRPFARVVLTAGGGLGQADQHAVAQPVEVLYVWRRFDTLSRMMVAANTKNCFQDIVARSLTHHDVTLRLSEFVSENAAGFLGGSDRFSLPIEVSEEASYEESVIASLMSFPTGLPGSSAEVQSLGRCCVKALISDVFGDASGLLVVEKEKQQEHEQKEDVATWLQVRGIQRRKHHRRGMINLANFLFWLDHRARESLSMLAALEHCTKVNGRPVASDLEARRRKFLRESDADSFVRRMLIRFGLLPFSMLVPRSGARPNPLRCPLTVGGGDNPADSLPIAGWFTADPRQQIETWETCVLASLVDPGQMRFALAILDKRISDRFGAVAKAAYQQWLPTMLLEHGLDAALLPRLGEAVMAGIGKAQSATIFRPTNFIASMLQNTSLAVFLWLMSKMQAENKQQQQQNKNNTTGAAAAAAAATPAANLHVPTVKQLLDTKIADLGSLTGCYSLLAKAHVGKDPVHGAFPVGVPPLSRLGDAVLFELLCNAKHPIANLPLYLQWKIVALARG